MMKKGINKQFVGFVISILFLLSTFYSYSQQSYIDSLKTALTFTKEDSIKVETLNRLCLAYAWSIPDTGMIYGAEALTLSKKLKWELGEAWAYEVMGYCLTTLGNYPLALDYIFKALALNEKANSKWGKMNSYSAVSLVYRDMGEYRQSLNYLWKAHSLVDPGVVNYVLGPLSSVYAKNNQPDSAIYFASTALKYEPSSSGILFVLGDSYYKLDHLDSANYFFDRGIAGAKVNRTEIDLVDLYHGKAQVYQSKNQLDSAIFFARKAMLEPFGKYYPRGVLNAITTLSDLYETKHQPDSTLKYLRAAISLRDSLFNREKTMAIQNLAFKEQEKLKDLEASQLKYRTQLRLNALTGSLFTLLVIAFLLFRNNKQKQKSFNLLRGQKQQIDIQKSELEHTLTNLKSTQAQLIQSEKMASLGELTAGIAHEIQNPLNFVNNFAEVNSELIDEIKQAVKSGNNEEILTLADNVKQNLEKINFHGKRADGIVKSMLQHSCTSDQSGKNKKEPTDINMLADEYLRLAYHGLRAKDKAFNATIKTDFDETLSAEGAAKAGLGMVEVASQDIARAILNLITNAFYAVHETDKKKKEKGESFAPTVSLSTKRLSKKIEIRVKDNGPGIPQHVLDKIFQPFFTTKPTGQGTGLGLSLCYDIVKAHGGEIKVISNYTPPGGDMPMEGDDPDNKMSVQPGTEFIISLPHLG